MADVKITLDAAHKDFVASLSKAADAAKKLVASMKVTEQGHKTLSAEATAAAQKTAQAELAAARTIVAAKQLILREAKIVADQQRQLEASVTAAAKQAAVAQMQAHQAAAVQASGTYAQMTAAAKSHFAEVKAAQRAAVSAEKTQQGQGRGTYEEMTKAARGHFALVSSEAKRVAKIEQDALKETQRAQAAALNAMKNQHAGTITGITKGVAAAVAGYYLLFEAVKKVASLISGSLTGAITHIDDFRKGTIGTAAAITNLADPTLRFGKTWNQVFQQNLKQTEGVFVELEKLAARYFASSIDLQLAYNAFAQRGVVLRRTELEQLAQLTDLILLLTQGQQSSIQVQEEIRSLVNGTLRPTAQLGQLIKSFGLDLKDVAAEIRATQSLKPLEGVLRGAKEATKEIQKTYQASLNGLQTLFLQLERVGGAALFGNVVAAIQRFTAFVQANQTTVVRLFSVVGTAAAKAIEFVEQFITHLFKANGTAGDSVTPFLNLAATILTVAEAIGKLFEALALFIAKLPVAVAEAVQEFSKVRKALEEGDKISSGNSSQGFFPNAAKGTVKFLSDNFTAAKAIRTTADTAQAAGKAFDKLGESLGGAFTGFFGQDFVASFKANLARLTSEMNGALGKLNDLRAGAKETFVGTRIPFKESDEDKAQRTQAAKATGELEKVVDRSRRNEQSATVLARLNLVLQELRRELALTDEGFKVMNLDIITGFDSAELVVAEFTKKFAAALSVGGQVDFSELSAGVQSATERVSARSLANLQAQLSNTQTAFKEFSENLEQNTQRAIIHATDELHREVEGLKNESKAGLDSLKASGEAAIAVIERQLAIAKQLQAPLTNATAQQGLQEAFGAATVSLSQTEQQITDLRAQMSKLETQARTAPEGFSEFLGQSNITALETQLDGLFRKAGAFREEIATLTPLVTAQSSKQVEAVVDTLTQNLTSAQDNLFAGIKNQLERNAKQQETINSIAKRIQLEEEKLREAQKFQLASGATNILEQELRIRQAILDLQVKAIEASKKQTELIAARVEKTAKERPRTSTEEALSTISGERAAFTESVAKETAALNIRTEAINQQAEVDIFGASMALQSVEAERVLLEKRTEAAEAAFSAAEQLAYFNLSIQGIRTAVTSAANGLFDALTQSFEGKKPDLLRVFKSVSDQLFKDAMKGFVESAGKTVSTAFTDLAGKIAPGMSKTLGPAFLAGFALIASFVLGQLLNGNKGSASPGNPQVGISSTEQVRGLIGGQTQIPIGLIGESLQDALVPTNLLLSRIAAGVDRLSFGGIDPSVIENTISYAISDALQIQLSAT